MRQRRAVEKAVRSRRSEILDDGIQDEMVARRAQFHLKVVPAGIVFI
jgi:hypothetical protein